MVVNDSLLRRKERKIRMLGKFIIGFLGIGIFTFAAISMIYQEISIWLGLPIFIIGMALANAPNYKSKNDAYEVEKE